MPPVLLCRLSEVERLKSFLFLRLPECCAVLDQSSVNIPYTEYSISCNTCWYWSCIYCDLYWFIVQSQFQHEERSTNLLLLWCRTSVKPCGTAGASCWPACRAWRPPTPRRCPPCPPWWWRWSDLETAWHDGTSGVYHGLFCVFLFYMNWCWGNVYWCVE